MPADKAQAYDTVMFAGPPPMKQRLWPRHCVQDTWGAELHKDLKVRASHLLVRVLEYCVREEPVRLDSIVPVKYSPAYIQNY